MSESIEEYIASWDPMGFIKKDGAPLDEYDMEAEEITRLFKTNMSDMELAHVVHSVFVEFMGIDPQGFLEECHTNAHEMRTILLGAS